jgi:tripartite-type tricarboxylate transporter receptor subunit TctC
MLPTLAFAQEQGLIDFEANYWNGLFLRKGTPEPIIQKLHDAVVATIDSPSVQARLKEIGVTIVAPVALLHHRRRSCRLRRQRRGVVRPHPAPPR